MIPPDERDAGDDALARLLRLAGPRPFPPVESTARVRRAVHAEWRRTVARRARGRTFVGLGAVALAAAVVLTVTSWQVRPPARSEATAVLVAVVARIDGAASSWPSHAASSARHPLQRSASLLAGAAVETPGGARLALRLSDGTSVRLDEKTRLVLTSPSVLSLEMGAVYVDSAGPDATPLEVHTTRGVARDVGTQFEVRMLAAEIRIRVREGAVRLSANGSTRDAVAGGELLTRGDQIIRGTVPRHGPEWRWVLGVAPSFRLEGASLSEFLAWTCRENGWTFRFSRPEDEARARAVALHGSIEQLDPTRALGAVLPTTGFTHRLIGGVLVIERTHEAP